MATFLDGDLRRWCFDQANAVTTIAPNGIEPVFEIGVLDQSGAFRTLRIYDLSGVWVLPSKVVVKRMDIAVQKVVQLICQFVFVHQKPLKYGQ